MDINVRHIIVEVGKERWEGETWKHPPVIAPVRQNGRKGQVEYELLWHGPRLELEDESDGLETAELTMKQLEGTLRKDREAARRGD